MLHVVASTDKPSYELGERPKLTMSVMNVGQQPCIQDIGHGQRELSINSASGERLWGSSDCSYADDKPERRPLERGKPVTFSVNWAGRTSSPGCSAERTTVKQGDYQVTAKIGEVPSVPAKFSIR